MYMYFTCVPVYVRDNKICGELWMKLPGTIAYRTWDNVINFCWIRKNHRLSSDFGLLVGYIKK